MKKNKLKIEICCNSVLSARNAKMGGAYRIELCQALSEGGTTPSAAAISYCVHELNLQTRVLVRPRGGNFCYDKEDFKVILDDINHVHRLGAHAVVVGFLTKEGDIDVAKTKAAVEAADGMSVTFHRAFDDCRNPHEALEQIIECGCHKLLTSGCKPTALEGMPLLRNLNEQAAGRIDIIAASGIIPSNVIQIVRETGLHEIHASCKTVVDGTSVTDATLVKQIFTRVDHLLSHDVIEKV